jgi:exopolysaccharide biosynthesis polyprenyl glycosylphosphotransferase
MKPNIASIYPRTDGEYANNYKIKFYSTLLLHLFLFFGFLFATFHLPSLRYTIKDILFSATFSVSYFFFVWYDLYSTTYHHYLKNAFLYIFKDLILSSLILFLLEYAFSIFWEPPSYTSFIIKDLLLIVYYFSAHLLQYFWIIHLADLGFFRKNVVLVGTYDERIPVEELYQNINNTKNFVGQLLFVDGAWRYRENLTTSAAVISKSLSNFLFSKKINELIICMDDTLTSEALHDCAMWCRENSIGYYLIPNLSKLPRQFPWQQRFPTIPSVERFCPNRDSLIMVSLKRLLDISVSAVALVLLAPVFLLIGVLIYLEDRGPIFYVSKRVGIHGKPINFIKFRSMVVNAEKLKQALLAMNERPDGPLFKIRNDPRVTRIGRILRDTSLDEFPQFINVLKGDMSLIGPRPHLPDEVAAYSDQDNLRLECIPGISCLPQIRGRDTIGFREWVDLDLEYRRRWSLWFDFAIIHHTALVVLNPLLRMNT